MRRTSENGYSVLVLGSETARDYAVIRSLGRAGILVTTATQAGVRSPFLSSRYVRKIITLPSKTRSESWLDALYEHLCHAGYDLVVPPDDFTIIAVLSAIDKLRDVARFTVPSAKAWEMTYYKDRTYALASQLGVPCPENVTVREPDELGARTKRFSFPVVVKPLCSKVAKGGELRWLRHGYALTREQLSDLTSSMLPYCGVTVQEFCPGIGFGQALLLNDGQALAAFQYERVHEPLYGGPSSYRRSVPIDEDVLQYSRAMLKRLGWTGVAMVEYKLDRMSGTIKLMEINGRFWGSLALPLAAGLDFPRLLFQLYVHGVLLEEPAYQAGIYCRSLTKDTSWFLENFRTPRRSVVEIRVPSSQIIAELGNLVRGREHFDELNLADPVPGLITVGRLIGQYSGAAVRKVGRQLRLRLAVTGVYAAIERWRLRATLRRLAGERVACLIVCKGNICRSPFAADALRRQLAHAGIDQVSVNSGGFVAVEGRMCPTQASSVASEFGIDLVRHRSRLLNEEDLRKADLIFYMDSENYKEILSSYPEFLKNTFALGASLRKTRDRFIPDPYKGSLEQFRACYGRIDQAVMELVSLIQRCY